MTPQPCPACQGTGTLRIVLADPTIPVDPLNDATVDADCNLCRGSGQLAGRCGREHLYQPGRACDRAAGHYGQCSDRRGGFPDGHLLGGPAA